MWNRMSLNNSHTSNYKRKTLPRVCAQAHTPLYYKTSDFMSNSSHFHHFIISAPPHHANVPNFNSVKGDMYEDTYEKIQRTSIISHVTNSCINVDFDLVNQGRFPPRDLCTSLNSNIRSSRTWQKKHPYFLHIPIGSTMSKTSNKRRKLIV